MPAPSAPPDSLELARRGQALQAEAFRLGFDVCGVAPLDADLRVDYFRQWLAEGQHGTMAWLADDLIRRLEPARILPGAKSLICVGVNYYQPPPERRGRIARYALGGDYHPWLYKQLKRLCRWLREQGADNRPYCDTGPLLEKPLAAAAGLGWQGKSTIVLHPKLGTWLLLGEVLTTWELPLSRPTADHCGKCTRCLDACPTGAITAPYQLDARRCLAYLTIEHHGPIPPEYREAMGDHLFGCDDCLDVCPWNRWAQTTRQARLQAQPLPDLRDMLLWTEDDFAAAMVARPMQRLGISRWRRNVAVVLGNIGHPDDLPALQQAANDTDPLVAEHAQWALQRLRQRLPPPILAALPEDHPPDGSVHAVFQIRDKIL